MLDRLMTTEDLVKYLNLDLRTIYGFIKNKKIPAIKIGREWRFRRKDIDSWLDEHRVTPLKISITKKKILVVDDEEDVRNLIARTLSRAGYEVEVAADGEGALEMLQRNYYHVLFTDQKMPGISGIELIEEARKLHPDIQALILTAFASQETAIDAVNLGCVGYLQKPLSDINDVVTAVNSAVRAAVRT